MDQGTLLFLFNLMECDSKSGPGLTTKGPFLACWSSGMILAVLQEAGSILSIRS